MRSRRRGLARLRELRSWRGWARVPKKKELPALQNPNFAH